MAGNEYPVQPRLKIGMGDLTSTATERDVTEQLANGTAPSGPAGRERTVLPSLVDALQSETRLLRELSTVLIRQQDALSTGDTSAVEHGVHAVHRLLHTLSVARDRRRSINRMLGEPEELSCEELVLALGSAATPAIRLACHDLVDAGHKLGEQLDQTSGILQRVIVADDVTAP